MKRIVAFTAVAVLAVAPFAGGSIAQGSAAAPRVSKVGPSPTQKVAGPQHWCGSNGITCGEPATNWDEIAGYAKAAARAPTSRRTSATTSPRLFYSNARLRQRRHLPAAPAEGPPTLPRQDGSGGTDDFQLRSDLLARHGAVRRPGLAEPRRVGADGHATVPCTPDSDTNIYANENTNSSQYFGLGPGQATWRCSSTRRAG